MSSDIIRLLPDSVANQIAAGEVIQRPASVIKELVENSLDAGASEISVIVTDAGKTSIQVVDNGKGMSETDARLSFERHATSKIRQATDLFALTTMGFRGEALASIAAVAQVILRTRQDGEETGTEIRIEGSRMLYQQPVLCDVGANFTVQNIFFNIPARRKFMKSNHTEMSNIMTEFERIVLAHPDIAFRLSTPTDPILLLPVGNCRQRIVNVFGKRIDKYLLNVKVETSIVRVTGFTGAPESSKRKGAQQFFFVNGRFMRHPYFAKAVQSAYEHLIPDGESVPFFLYLEVDPSRIDVNIHPTKTEIKFEDEQTIWQILLAAVREALGKYSAIPTIDFDTAGRPDIPLFNDSNPDVRPPKINVNPAFNPFDTPDTGMALHHIERDAEYADPFTDNVAVARRKTDNSLPQVQPPMPLFSDAPPSQEQLSQGLETAFHTAVPQTSMDIPTGNTETDFFGCSHTETMDFSAAGFLQYKGRYLLTPLEEGLLLIDAHRAHFRVLYDAIMSDKDRPDDMVPQRLLFPETIDFPPSEIPVVQQMMEKLARLGFELSPLGGSTFSVLSLPAGLEGLDSMALLQEMVSEAAQIPVDAQETIMHHLALTLARKMAIPVGQVLTIDEMRDLTTRLFATANPNITPNGHRITALIPHQSVLSRF